MDTGYRLHLANQAAIQKYKGVKHSDDNDDAFWLAHMLRLNIETATKKTGHVAELHNGVGVTHPQICFFARMQHCTKRFVHNCNIPR